MGHEEQTHPTTHLLHFVCADWWEKWDNKRCNNYVCKDKPWNCSVSVILTWSTSHMYVSVALHTWKSSNATMFSCFSSCRDDIVKDYLLSIALIFYIFHFQEMSDMTFRAHLIPMQSVGNLRIFTFTITSPCSWSLLLSLWFFGWSSKAAAVSTIKCVWIFKVSNLKQKSFLCLPLLVLIERDILTFGYHSHLVSIKQMFAYIPYYMWSLKML